MEKKRQTHNAPSAEIAELIVDGILEEKFLNRAQLIPKVAAILKGFNANTGVTRYNKIETPTRMAKMIYAAEKKEAEQKFWFNLVRKMVNADDLKIYQAEGDEHLKKLGYLK